MEKKLFKKNKMTLDMDWVENSSHSHFMELRFYSKSEKIWKITKYTGKNMLSNMSTLRGQYHNGFQDMFSSLYGVLLHNVVTCCVELVCNH